MCKCVYKVQGDVAKYLKDRQFAVREDKKKQRIFKSKKLMIFNLFLKTH